MDNSETKFCAIGGKSGHLPEKRQENNKEAVDASLNSISNGDLPSSHDNQRIQTDFITIVDFGEGKFTESHKYLGRYY